MAPSVNRFSLLTIGINLLLLNHVAIEAMYRNKHSFKSPRLENLSFFRHPVTNVVQQCLLPHCCAFTPQINYSIPSEPGYDEFFWSLQCFRARVQLRCSVINLAQKVSRKKWERCIVKMWKSRESYFIHSLCTPREVSRAPFFKPSVWHDQDSNPAYQHLWRAVCTEAARKRGVKST